MSNLISSQWRPSP